MDIILDFLGTDLHFTLLTTICAIVVIALGALFGSLRGLHRSIIIAGSVVLSFACAFFVARPLFADKIYGDAISMVLSRFDLSKLPDAVKPIITAYGSAIVAPLVFLALFIVFNLVFYIVFGIVGALVFPKRKYEENKESSDSASAHHLKRHRGLGAVVGALVTIIFVAEINVAVYGYSELADKFSPLLDEFSDKVHVTNTNGLCDTLTKLCFGDKVFDALTTASVDGEVIHFTEQADDICTIAVSAMKVSATPVKEWQNTEKDALLNIFRAAENEVLGVHTTEVVVDVVQDYLTTNELVNQALDKSPAIKTAFDSVMQGLDNRDDGTFQNLLHATEELVIIGVDAIQTSDDGKLDVKTFVNNADLVNNTVNVLVNTPELDAVTIATVDMALDKMADQFGLDNIGHVDVEAWSDATAEERAEEAKLMATVIPQVVEVTTDENGEEQMSFNYSEAMLDLRESTLVGEIVEDALHTVTDNYVQEFTSGNLVAEDIPDYVRDLIGEYGISLPSIPGLQ